MQPHWIRGQVVYRVNSHHCYCVCLVFVLHSFQHRQISAIATDNTAASLTQISGYLLYPDGATDSVITVTTKDDLIPEPSTVFKLQLTSSNGGARIESTASSASVTGKWACLSHSACF